jgi:alcohol dehydrogenase class IV
VFIKDGKKITIEDEKLIPDNYILDPERVVSLSPFQTASTGLDALCHAIESWWSPNSTKESRSYAKRALKGLVRDLYDSYCYPYSQTLRWKMLEHANYAGRAINITRTSICHAISYPLTVHYGIPHGIACARTLPFFIRYFGFYRIDAKKIEKLLRGLNANFNTEIDKEMVAEKALQSERVNNTPLPVTKEIILKSL